MGWVHCVVVAILLGLLIYLQPSAFLPSPAEGRAKFTPKLNQPNQR